MVLRTDFSGDPLIGAVLDRARETTLDAFAHEDMPFDRLVEDLKPERVAGLNPFFQVKFMLQNAPIGDLNLEDLTLQPMNTVTGGTKLELQLNMWEWEGGLNGVFVFKTDVFKKPAIQKLIRHFEGLLKGFCEDTDTPLAQLFDKVTGEDEQLEADQLNETRAKGAARFKKKGRRRPKVKL